ncbi:MAG TPA: hypothetical protein VKG26_16560 [Bacteroidia bacterium]|nr:hypothetical protein [Bacteroidia bacterium]
MITTEYPIWLVLVCLLAGLGYAFLLYRKPKQDVNKTIHYSLFVLRFLVVSFLCFFMLNPLIKNTTTYTEKPIIIIAADNSASVTKNKDSVFYKNEFPGVLHKFSEALADKYEVHALQFAGDINQNDALNFSGKETNLSNVFTDVQNNFEGKNVGAVVLATDGLYNTGSNPLSELGNANYPVYTIALGDTTLQRDAYIKKINHNQTAYIGNQFPVEVQVQSADLQGKEAILSILQDGKKLMEQKIKYATHNYTSILNFLLSADKAGVQRYQAVLSFIDGEQIKNNNSMAFVVDVIDKREKILLLVGAPHPDVAALKQTIEANQSYEVEVQLAEHFNTSLKPYSLLILHNVNQNNTAYKKLSTEIALNKTPVWQFSKNDFWAFSFMKFGNSISRYNDAEPVFNTGFSLFNISNELKSYMKDFPAVSCALTTYKVSNGAVALVNQQIGQVQTENPILVFADNGGQKSALFCAEGLWRWKLRDYADHENNELFDELIQKTVQYLSVKADKSFFRVFTKKISSENEPLEFDAEAFNPSYELINEPDVSIIIKDEAKKQFNYTFSKTSNAYHLSAGNFPAGDYTYTAQVKINNQVCTQKGTFTVKPLLAELTNTTADHALLYNISKKTGGQLFYPKQLNDLQNKLLNNDNIKTLVHEQKQVNDFINLKTLFFILLVFLSIEWFVRKYNGLS